MGMVPQVAAAERSQAQAFRGRATFIVLFYALFIGFLFINPVRHAALVALNDVARALSLLLTAGLCLWPWRWTAQETVRRHGCHTAGDWAPLLLGLGVLSAGIGQGIWTVDEVLLHQTTPFPSWADVGLLSAYPFLLAGLLLLPGRPLRRAASLRLVLDGLTIMVALGTLSWYLILGPTLLEGKEPLFSQLVGLAYPSCDLVLLACLFLLPVRADDLGMRSVVRVLGLGLSLIMISDSYFAYATMEGTFTIGGWVDPTWTLGYLLIALAAYALRQALARRGAATAPLPAGGPAETEPPPPLWRLLLPYPLLLAVAAFALYVPLSGSNKALEQGSAIRGILLVGLVLLRQVVVLLDNRALLRRLSMLTAHLEQRVAERTVQLEAAVVDLQVQIDHRRQVEHALVESETSFRHLFTGIPLPAWVYDRQTLRFLEVNDTAIAQYGYSREEFLAMAITDIRPAEDIPRVIAVAHTVGISPERAGVWRHRYKDGRLVDVEISAHQLDFDGHRAIIGLIQDVTERLLAEAIQARQARHSALRADVGTAFTYAAAAPLSALLQQCAEAVVGHLEAAFACVWTLSTPGGVLELQASAGMYTHPDGPHNRVPVGALKLGLIAQERRPHLTNDVLHDPWIDDPMWAERESLRAFAGYPLLVADQVVGVLALFARQPLPEDTLVALATVADVIAHGIARQRAEVAIQWAREEAEEASAAKSVFLSRMSHELRTPLNAILGFGQLLEGRDLGTEGNAQVGQVLTAGRHLLALVDGVLDITRVEERGPTPTRVPVGVAPCVADVLAGSKVRAAARHIQLIDDVAAAAGAGGWRVMADQAGLAQALGHLVENAITFNRAGGLVTVAAAALPEGRLRLLVRDSGPGLRRDEIERLFVPFERLDAEQRGIGGTGMGLVLAQRLVEAMGGTIGVESVVGQGSTFWIELPLAPPATEQPAGLPAAGPAGPLAPPRPGTVLYVEETLTNTALITNLVRRFGAARLLTATQGVAALTLAGEYHPDLILLVLPLPDLSAEEMLRRLKTTPATAALPVAVLSADATPAHAAALHAAGAMAHLTLPLQIAPFRALLEEILTKRKG